MIMIFVQWTDFLLILYLWYVIELSRLHDTEGHPQFEEIQIWIENYQPLVNRVRTPKSHPLIYVVPKVAFNWFLTMKFNSISHIELLRVSRINYWTLHHRLSNPWQVRNFRKNELSDGKLEVEKEKSNPMARLKFLDQKGLYSRNWK